MYEVAAACTIYTYMLNLVLKNVANFFFLNAPSFLLHLPFFVCAVSVPAPLTRHEHSGAPRVQQ